MVNHEYLNWIFGFIGLRDDDIYHKTILSLLMQQEFKYSNPLDENRASDGLYLRYLFEVENPIVYSGFYEETRYREPCSMLEMMVYLSYIIEQTYYDSEVGFQLIKWIDLMLYSLGLTFDEHQLSNINIGIIEYITDKINRFTNREYSPSGDGSLFRIPDAVYDGAIDMRNYDIWYQFVNWTNYNR